MNGACKDCAHCTDNGSGNFSEFTCAAVRDPYNGAPMNVRIARQESHPTANFTLPCGFVGKLWKFKGDA